MKNTKRTYRLTRETVRRSSERALPRLVLILALSILVSSCILLQPRMLKYAYKYECLKCEMDDTVLYSNVLYYPQDTVIILPSKKMIIITDVSFAKNPKFRP